MANDVSLGLGVNTSQAAKDLKQFGSAAKSSADRISKSFSGIAVAVGGALAGLASLAILKDITEAASIQQDAINKLNTSLKSAGDFSQAASEDIQTFASELQKVSTIGDETTLELFALGKTFGRTNEETKKLTEAAIELSAATGTELSASVELLGRTFSGSAGRLNQTIPALQGLSKEALASGAAIQFVLDRFGGSAQAQLQTFSGVTQALSNSFGDLKEELGFAIVENEALIIALNNLNQIIIALGGNVKENRSILNDFVTGAVNVAVFAVAELAKFTQVLIDTFFAVIQAIKIANIAFFEFFKAIAGAPADIANAFGDLFEFLINGFASALTGLFEIFEKIPGFTKVFGEVSKEAAAAGSRLSKQFKSFGTVFDGAQKASDEYFDGLILGQEKVIFENELARQSYQDITDTVVGFAEKTASEIQNASGTIRKESKEAGKAIKANIEKPLSDAQKKAAETEQKFKEFFQGLERESGTLEEQILKIGEALTTAANDGDFDKFKTFYDKLKGLQKEYADQIQKDEDARVKAIAESLAASQKEFEKAVNVGTSIASSILGGAGGEQVDTSELKTQIDNLSNALANGALSEKETLDVQEKLADKQKQLLDAENKNFKNASSAISEIGGLVTDIFLPGFGGVASQILGLLSSGPENIKAFIRGFVEAIPEVIDAIAESIPVVIEVLIEKAPEIIDAITSASPKIIAKLVERSPDIIKALVLATPEIVKSLVRGILRQTFKVNFDFEDIETKFKDAAQAVVDAFLDIPEQVGKAFESIPKLFEDAGKNFTNAIVQGGKDFVAALLRKLGIGGGGSNDDGGGFGVNNISTQGLKDSAKSFGGRFPKFGLTEPAPVQTARQFSSSQDKTDNSQLIQDFSKAISESLGNKVATLLTSGTTRPLVVNLEVGQAQLASVLLQLNRNGFRTA